MAKRVLLGLMLTVAVAGYAWGAPTAEQKAELRALADVMAKAATLFKEKKFEDCGTAIREAHEVGPRPVGTRRDRAAAADATGGR